MVPLAETVGTWSSLMMAKDKVLGKQRALARKMWIECQTQEMKAVREEMDRGSLFSYET